MNKISIITVNRNNADGLDKTIKSVIGQTYTNYEFIIIDGASTDNSVEIIKQYTDHITDWISEKDSGIFNAMNKGIRKAGGDYCFFLNSGDSFPQPDILNAIFENKHYTAPFINGHQMNDMGTYQHRLPCRNRPLTLYDFYYSTIKHQATFMRRDLFDTYGLYDENYRVVSDWKFFLETIGLHNEQPEYVELDVVLFEWNGISTNPQFKELLEAEKKSVLDELIPKSIQEDYIWFNDMSNYEYLFKAMKKNKLLNIIVRGLVKILG